MSIQSEIERLQNAKENLKTAITGKGVTVPDSAKLDEYSSFVNGIQQGNNVDLSFVTAGAGDILSGKVGTDKDGKPVNGSIETVTPSLSGNKFTVGKGFVPENKELTVAEAKAPTVSFNIVTVYQGYMDRQSTVEIPKATATLSANVVTIPAGYHDSNTVTVPEAHAPTVSGNTVTIHPGYVPTERTVETEGGGGESAFDIVKVTEYSPYVPAYPEQIGYIFDIDMQWYNWETSVEEPYDASAYEGLYTVTEETKSCTGLGRVFRNANGKWLYAFSYDNWEQATDSSNSAQWCIGDDLGYSPESGAFMYSDTVSKGTLPNSNSSWNSMMYTVKACTITTQVTAPATEAIPMVLKGSKAESYNTETGIFVDGSSQTAYSGFEIEPYKEWYYASTNGKLIGGSIGSNVATALYVPMELNANTAVTGQRLVGVEGTPTFTTKSGVPCCNMWNTASLAAENVEYNPGENPSMSISFFINVSSLYEGENPIFEAFGPSGGFSGQGLEIFTGDGNYLCIRGGKPTDISNNNYYKRSDFSFNADKWYHVCIVFYGGVYEEYYVNGEFQERHYFRRFFEKKTNTCAIGCDLNRDCTPVRNRNHFRGYMAQLKYYSGIVSPVQIKLEADRCLAMVTE